MTLNYKYLGLVYSFCKLFQDKLCGAIIDPLINTNFHNTHRIDYSKIPNLFRNEPGGSSVQNLQHWIQLDQYQEMIMFDYGSKKKNKQHYGQPTPPKYNYKAFENFDIPSYITKTDADPFSLNLDTKILEDYLSEEAKKKIIFKVLDNYNHLDYVWSDTSYDEFYSEVMDFFNKNDH